jgi:hypothetical protein
MGWASQLKPEKCDYYNIEASIVNPDFWTPNCLKNNVTHGLVNRQPLLQKECYPPNGGVT